MSNGIYVALSGNVAIERNMNVVSNNLANASTIGYKKDRAVFANYIHEYENNEIDEKMRENGTPQDKDFSMIDDVYTDHSVGGMKETGNPLDIALAGDAYFKIRKGEDVLFQRSGIFTLNNDGVVTAPDGSTLLDQGGNPIVLDPQFPVHIDESGGVWQDEFKVADIWVAQVENTEYLEKEGDTRFRLLEDGVETIAEDIPVMQGFLETSNVNAVAEMVEMIKVQRHYDSAAKAIKSYSEMDRNAINKVGSVN